MKFVTKNCEVRNFTVTLYDKEHKEMLSTSYSDDSNMSENQLLKAVEKAFGMRALDAELVSTDSGIHRMRYEEFVKLSTAEQKAIPGCVNRNIAVTDYKLFLYDKSARSVTEQTMTDYDEREQEQILKDVNKALKASGDNRIAVDIEPLASSECMRSVPLWLFMEKSEKVETA